MSESRPTQREYWNSKVGDEWVRQADRTDAMFANVTAAAFRTLALQANERVLDIGCGAGATALRAAREVGAGGGVTGVDISQSLLALGRDRARAGGLKVDFIEADAGAAAIPGAPFEVAVSRFGVMFFEDPPSAFARVRENLRSDGRLVFVCWRTFAENAWASTPAGALSPLLAAPLPAPDESLPGPFAFADAHKIRATLEAAGWREIAIEPWDGVFSLGADAEDAAAYALRIGPCARAIAEHGLDPAAAKQLIVKRLAAAQTAEGVMLAAACWIVRAIA
jgi:SAM-dependent methyltransferase